MSEPARDSECRFTPAWQPGADANLQRAGKQPSAAQDRTVHAVTYKGVEIVRYDRAGEWWIEWPSGSLIPGKRVGVAEAARTAVDHSGDIRLGLPGGKVFDAKVRTLRGF